MSFPFFIFPFFSRVLLSLSRASRSPGRPLIGRPRNDPPLSVKDSLTNAAGAANRKCTKLLRFSCQSFHLVESAPTALRFVRFVPQMALRIWIGHLAPDQLLQPTMHPAIPVAG